MQYGPASGPAFEAPYGPGFEMYPYNGGGPVMGPVDYPPVAFGPPPPRLPHYPHGAAGRVGRVYPPFPPPYPHSAPSFPRGHLKLEAGWTFPPAPPRPCLPGRGFERPPPVPYSQPLPRLRTPEFGEPPEEAPYSRNPVLAPGFPEGPPPPDPVHYESRPGIERDYHSYGTDRYHVTVDGREKHSADYNGAAGDDCTSYYTHRCDSQSEGGRYGKYDPPPPAEKLDSGRPYPPYARLEDPRVEFATDYRRNSVTEDNQKDYRGSGSYTGYWNSSSSYPTKPSTEPVVDKYKEHVASEAYKYRIEDYPRGEGYPSTEYTKEPRSADYEYSRAADRYASDYKSRESAYYERRSGEYADRSHRDADPRGSGGPERTRQRSSHRPGPYDR